MKFSSDEKETIIGFLYFLVFCILMYILMGLFWYA